MAKTVKRKSLIEMALGGEGVVEKSDQYRLLPSSALKPGPWQARTQFDKQDIERFAQTLRQQGILQPLLVQQDGEDYLIIAGERRWRAAQLAGMEFLPCLVKTGLTSRDAALHNLLENLQREDLNPIDEGRGYQTILDNHELTQQELSDVLGVAVDRITRVRHLLDLDETVQALVADKQLSASHALILRGLSANVQMELAQRAIQRDLSVQALKELVHKLKVKTRKQRSANRLSTKLSSLNQRLNDYLQVPVNIKPSAADGSKGEVRIKYSTSEELEKLIKTMGLPDWK